jgi:hypothetical protein
VRVVTGSNPVAPTIYFFSVTNHQLSKWAKRRSVLIGRFGEDLSLQVMQLPISSVLSEGHYHESAIVPYTDVLGIGLRKLVEDKKVGENKVGEI